MYIDRDPGDFSPSLDNIFYIKLYFRISHLKSESEHFACSISSSSRRGQTNSLEHDVTMSLCVETTFECQIDKIHRNGMPKCVLLTQSRKIRPLLTSPLAALKNDPPGRFKTKESEVEFYLTQGGQVRLRRACSRVLKILAFGPSAGLVWAAFYHSPWLRSSPNWLQYSSLYDVAYSALTFGKVILGNSSIFFAGSITALVSWLFVYVWSEDIRRKADELDTRVHWARREISAAEQTHALIRSSNIAAGPQIYYQNLPVDIWGVIASCLRRDTLVRLALVSRAYRPFILSKVDGITSADLKYWGSTDEQSTVSFLHSVAPLAQTRFGSQLRRVEIPAAKYYLTCEAIQLVAALPFLEELTIGEPQAEMSDSSVNVYRRMRLKMSMHVMETFQQCEFAALRSLDISRVTLDESVNCSQYICTLNY
jgi:hypothetical protein